ncbi:lipase family protein [Xenorhabdus bovienii]|uniref:Putative lipase protein n=1 Tax=Xenorhabdus bovienii TaxID=40576 RepID=A0A0B6X8K5_XENBV|nr:lipase family protein [Xenorhabdus bovienii]CDM88624.1 putative lipase protein [Xenorhabdus bovienii]
MSNANSVYCSDCLGMLKNKIEIQLVDEHNKPIANMPYTLKNHKMTRKGTTDGSGMIREEHLTASPLRLFLDGQKLADEMETRPLRVKRNNRYAQSKESMAKISTVFAESQKSGRQYLYAKIGELVDKTPVIKDWKKEIPLPCCHFPDNEPMGLEVIPTVFEHYRYVIEVCPFRAWSLLLHHQKDYSLVNAYNLSLMSILTYSDDNEYATGSVVNLFNDQMLDISELPYRFNDQSFTPVVYDVPFSDRYTEVEFIDSDKQEPPQGHTQLFYAVNKQEIIIGWRGTEPEKQDIITDLTFQPIELGCTPQGVCSGFSEKGKVHKGFWDAFYLINNVKISRKGNIEVFKHIFELAQNRKLFICGHSLGGALALLHSAQLKAQEPRLYTYGMPRVFTKNAVQEFTQITHYRHVNENENDTVPSVPFHRDMDNNSFKKGEKILGYYTEVANTPIIREILSAIPITSLTIPHVKKIKKQSDNNDHFFHHGKLVHFSIAYHENLKLYIIPDLNKKNMENTMKAIEQQEDLNRLRKQEENIMFNGNENPSHKGGLGPFAHSSTKYAKYIDLRLTELCSSTTNQKPQTNQKDYSVFTEKKLSYTATPAIEIQKAIARRLHILKEIDGQLATTLEVTRKDEKGSIALQRYYNYKNSNAR